MCERVRGQEIKDKEVRCENCGWWVRFDLDLRLEGIHITQCPNCQISMYSFVKHEMERRPPFEGMNSMPEVAVALSFASTLPWRSLDKSTKKQITVVGPLVYCKDCDFYYSCVFESTRDHYCRHPNNVRKTRVVSWHGISYSMDREVLEPQRINQHNDCGWYERRVQPTGTVDRIVGWLRG
jgi:hypothetical protein